MFPHQSWIPQLKAPRFQAFGGPLLNGHARNARPFSRRLPMLLVLKSAVTTKGRYDLLRYQSQIQRMISRLCRRFEIRVVAFNLRDSHFIHIVVQAPNRKALANLLRAFSGLVARLVWSAQRGSPAKALKGFWSQRPYSQILSWGSEVRLWSAYILRKTAIFSSILAKLECENLSNTS